MLNSVLIIQRAEKVISHKCKYLDQKINSSSKILGLDLNIGLPQMTRTDDMSCAESRFESYTRRKFNYIVLPLERKSMAVSVFVKTIDYSNRILFLALRIMVIEAFNP